MITRVERVWWREEPLNCEQSTLFMAVLQAHARSACRENASTVAVAMTADSSQDMANAFAAGLMTLGERHAPVEATFRFLSLSEPHLLVEGTVKTGGKIPGWGGSFQKNKPDPIWNDVSTILAEDYPNLFHKLELVTATLFEHQKPVYPNPSAYTAATAIALGMNAKQAVFLFICGRLDVWAKIATKRMEARTWDTSQE